MPEIGEPQLLRSPTVVTLINGIVFDDDPTAYNSASVDTAPYRRFLLYLQILSTATPTDIRFIVQFSDDVGTTWWMYKQGLFASLYFEDQDTASVVNECFGGDVEGRLFRLRAVATGTTATNKFTVTAKVEFWTG